MATSSRPSCKHKGAYAAVDRPTIVYEPSPTLEEQINTNLIMGFFSTHASGTLDPPEVRNWRIHLIALIASMSAVASKSQ
jgi:hypothetical protein